MIRGDIADDVFRDMPPFFVDAATHFFHDDVLIVFALSCSKNDNDDAALVPTFPTWCS